MGKLKAKLILALFFILVLLVYAERGYGQELRSPAQVYLEAGDKLYEQGKLKEALSAYEQALTLDPKNQYASFQIVRINVKLSSGEKRIVDALPPRDYSKISYELGPYYKDPVNKFALKYPKGWLLDNTHPGFNVKFIDPYYEAFIFVKVIPTSSPVLISYGFQNQVESLLRELTRQIPNASLKYCNFERFLEHTVLRVEIHYLAGGNRIIVNSRLWSDLDRVVLISWVCQEKLFPIFRPWLESSVASFTLNPN